MFEVITLMFQIIILICLSLSLYFRFKNEKLQDKMNYKFIDEIMILQIQINELKRKVKK